MPFDKMPTREEIVDKLKAELDDKRTKQADAVEPARRWNDVYGDSQSSAGGIFTTQVMNTTGEAGE